MYISQQEKYKIEIDKSGISERLSEVQHSFIGSLLKSLYIYGDVDYRDWDIELSQTEREVIIKMKKRK